MSIYHIESRILINYYIYYIFYLCFFYIQHNIITNDSVYYYINMLYINKIII